MAPKASTPMTFAASHAAAVAQVRAAGSDPAADLREERARASFAPAALTNFLYGEATAARRRYLEDLVQRCGLAHGP
jgi:hypothetical protein